MQTGIIFTEWMKAVEKLLRSDNELERNFQLDKAV
jgi:hypothetical protein